MALSWDLRLRIVDLVASGVSRRKAAKTFKVYNPVSGCKDGQRIIRYGNAIGVNAGQFSGVFAEMRRAGRFNGSR
jgi:hypothetical protein